MRTELLRGIFPLIFAVLFLPNCSKTQEGGHVFIPESLSESVCAGGASRVEIIAEDPAGGAAMAQALSDLPDYLGRISGGVCKVPVSRVSPGDISSAISSAKSAVILLVARAASLSGPGISTPPSGLGPEDYSLYSFKSIQCNTTNNTITKMLLYFQVYIFDF